MAAPISRNRVTPVIFSLFIPGIGQLLQGRPVMGLVHLVLAIALWSYVFCVAWLIHIWSALDAAWWRPRT